MKTLKNTIILLLSFILIFLTGCSNNSKNESIVEEIKNRGYITIATSGDNPPTIYPDENNELVGLDADWAKEIADYLGVEIEWKRMDFKGIIPSITSKQVDIGMSGISVTEERAKEIDFTEHYAFEDVIAIFPEDTTDIKSPLDIKDKKVGVVAGSHNGEAPAKEIGGYEDLISYPSVSTALEDLKNGRTDVVLTGRIVGGDWLQKEGEGFKMSEEGYKGSKIAIAVDKDNSELKELINEAITKGKESGKYEEYAKKHVGTEFVE